MMKREALSELGRRTQPPPISWLMELALSRPGLISLAAGFTDNETLPVPEAGELLHAVLCSGKSGRAALQYGPARGDLRLRELTAERLRRLDGVAGTAPAYMPERMIITNGSQQLLYLVTEALCDTGDIVLVEDPTYFVYLGILQSRGVQARGVRLEPDGLDAARLEEVLNSLQRSGDLSRVKALYVVSYFQNPSGISTRFDKKREILGRLRRFERAAGHPIYLIEDAAYRELRFAGDEIASALAVPGFEDRTVYAGTYSKPFATGARVGFGLLPEPLFTAVLGIKGNHDFGTSNLLQQLLARALSTGRYQKHLGELRARYAAKAGVMVQSLRRSFPSEVEFQRPAGGMYCWVRLPTRMKSGMKSNLFQSALANNVLYVPGELCYANDPTRRKPSHEMRLSFGNARPPDIRAGIERLGRAFRAPAGRATRRRRRS